MDRDPCFPSGIISLSNPLGRCHRPAAHVYTYTSMHLQPYSHAQLEVDKLYDHSLHNACLKPT